MITVRQIYAVHQWRHENWGMFRFVSLYLFSLQLFTFGHVYCMFVNFTILNILGYFILTSYELNIYLRTIYKFLFMTASCHHYLACIEMTMIRYWMKFVWKKIPLFDTQFIFVFLEVLNVLISSLVGASRFLTKEDINLDAKFLGVDISKAPEPEYRLK